MQRAGPKSIRSCARHGNDRRGRYSRGGSRTGGKIRRAANSPAARSQRHTLRAPASRPGNSGSMCSRIVGADGTTAGVTMVRLRVRGIARRRRGSAASGSNCTRHDLRHTSTTWAMQRGMAQWIVSGFSEFQWMSRNRPMHVMALTACVTQPRSWGANCESVSGTCAGCDSFESGRTQTERGVNHERNANKWA